MVVLLRYLLLLLDIISHVVEVTRVELPQVSYQILIDNFVADESSPQLGQFKLNRIHVQYALRCLRLLTDGRSGSIKRRGLSKPEYLF